MDVKALPPGFENALEFPLSAAAERFRQRLMIGAAASASP